MNRRERNVDLRQISVDEVLGYVQDVLARRTDDLHEGVGVRRVDTFVHHENVGRIGVLFASDGSRDHRDTSRNLLNQEVCRGIEVARHACENSLTTGIRLDGSREGRRNVRRTLIRIVGGEPRISRIWSDVQDFLRVEDKLVASLSETVHCDIVKEDTRKLARTEVVRVKGNILFPHVRNQGGFAYYCCLGYVSHCLYLIR